MMIVRQSIGKREEQQDDLFFEKKGNVIFAVVADGLGGMRDGKIASECVCLAAKKLFETETPTIETAKSFLNRLKDDAESNIKKKSSDSCSTVAALLIVEKKAFIMYSGDTRVYHFNGNKLISRTKDHSLSQILFEQGKITEAEMRHHSSQNKLFNCLGSGSGNESDFIVIDTLQAGDWFLLCSDGLWENLSLEELSTMYSNSEVQADEILARALKNGGDSCDNITFVCVYPNFKFVDTLKSKFGNFLRKFH